MSGRVGAGDAARGLTRQERSALRKAAWAQANKDLQREFADASAPLGASREQRRATRQRRQEARQRRDVQARVGAAAAIEVAAARKAAQPHAAAMVAAVRSQVALTPLQRRSAAIEEQATATWLATRPATRQAKARANQQAWAQLQLDRLTATAAARTSKRGIRRQAKSQAWLAAQAARITAGLQSNDGLLSTNASTDRTSRHTADPAGLIHPAHPAQTRKAGDRS